MAFYHFLFVLALYYGIDALKLQIQNQRQDLKTFTYVSSCMQNVTEMCSDRCANSDNQTHYAECLKIEEVSTAYNMSIGNFLECVGEDKPCLKLNLTINYGEDCWGKCSARGYQRCLEKCKVSKHDSEEAKSYLQCALQMNPAHAIFWKCLQQLEPSLVIEDPNAGAAVSSNATVPIAEVVDPHAGHTHP